MFHMESSMYHPGYYMIKLNTDALVDKGIKCNYYPILAARLFKMRLAEYLRFLRDKCGATLIGKTGWTVAYFADARNCNQVVAELNQRWRKINEEAICNITKN